MSLIWATRGRTWGFRFLLTDGPGDPLPAYEAVFSRAGDGSEVCVRVGEKVALRFPDPLGRKDRAGRVIPHEFVVGGELADQVGSVADGLRVVWNRPEIEGEFARVWDQPQ